ncbi:hypothetical protein BVX98_00400, partial [bacterium F11]
MRTVFALFLSLTLPIQSFAAGYDLSRNRFSSRESRSHLNRVTDEPRTDLSPRGIRAHIKKTLYAADNTFRTYIGPQRATLKVWLKDSEESSVRPRQRVQGKVALSDGNSATLLGFVGRDKEYGTYIYFDTYRDIGQTARSLSVNIGGHETIISRAKPQP